MYAGILTTCYKAELYLYLAYGGEWLTLPLMLMLAEVARSVGDVIRFLFGKEDGYGSDGD